MRMHLQHALASPLWQDIFHELMADGMGGASIEIEDDEAKLGNEAEALA